MRHKRSILIAAPLVLFLVFGLIASCLRRPDPPPDFLDHAKTAGYSNLIAVANQITAESTNAAAYLAQDTAAAAALDRALHNVIDAPATAYHDHTIPVHDHMAIKALAKALVAKGDDAETRGVHKEAAEAYLQALRLGVQYEHGPLVSFLFGSAVERISLRPLRKALSNLSNTNLLAVAQEIQAINHDRLSFDEIVRRENYFAAVNAPNIIILITSRFSSRSRSVLNKSRKIHRDLQTELEGLAAASAALCYSRENATALPNIDALVPTYLHAPPLDPFAKAPLRVLPFADHHCAIYSVGPNGRDDMGRGDDIVFSVPDFASPAPPP